MKITSLEANKKAENSGLKLSHQKRILAVVGHITNAMNYMEISVLCGLTSNEVYRRMSELERKGNVRILKEQNGYSLYYKPVIEQPLLSEHAYKRKQFERWKKQVDKFAPFLSEEIIKQIKTF